MAQSPTTPQAQERVPSENPGTACVLVCKGEAPEELLASLSQRRVVIESHGDEFAAMAAVLRRGKAGSPLVLLVVEPGRIGRADEMVRTVERFVPHVVCWRYDAGRSPALRGYVPPPPAPAATIETFVSRARGGQPRLRLTGLEDGEGEAAGDGARRTPAANPEAGGGVGPVSAPAAEAVADAPAGSPGGELLSSEELSMLLSDDWPRRSGESGL